MNKSKLDLIRFDLPFGDAKDAWNTLCESAYISEIMHATYWNLSAASAKYKIDRKYVRRLIRKYKLLVCTPIEAACAGSILVRETFVKSKQAWMEQFEHVYLTHTYAKMQSIVRLSKEICLDRKHVRKLLRKYKITKSISTEMEPEETMFIAEEPKPVHQQTKEERAFIKLHRRFHNGINFERGMIAYLYVDGEQTTREGVHQISRLLGGLQIHYGHVQYMNWNRLQNFLTKIGVLIKTSGYCIYNWNDTLIPIEYKHALERKRAGESVEKILAFYFPNDAI